MGIESSILSLSPGEEAFKRKSTSSTARFSLCSALTIAVDGLENGEQVFTATTAEGYQTKRYSTFVWGLPEYIRIPFSG
jgi:hypothetical protein